MSEEQLQGSETPRDLAPVHREVLRWFSVLDNLPPLEEPVLFCCFPDEFSGCSDAYVGVFKGKKTKGKAIAMEYGYEDEDWLPCTHWMPLPELPKFPV